MEQESFPQLDAELCSLCGLCVAVCPNGALILGQEQLESGEDCACDGCGVCEDVAGGGAGVQFHHRMGR